MAVAKSVKRVTAPAKGSKAKQGPTAAPAPGIILDIPLHQVQPSPKNPRKTFDEKSLRELGEKIKAHGQAQAILVRPAVDGVYELVAGERRWRASQLVKLPTIRAEVREVSETDVVILRLMENFDREDLNAVDQAHAFQEATAGGLTQQQLADALHLSQPVIANRIRLLQLPEEWQAKIISQEITETQGRALVPWAKYPAVLAEVAKDLKAEGKNGFVPGHRWEWFIQSAVQEVGRSMSPNSWRANPRQFKPTAEQLAALDVKKVGDEEYAMNAALWDELQAKALEKRKAKEEAEADRESAAPTAAEKREAAKAKAEQFGKKLYRYKVGWLQQRIAERILKTTDSALVLRIALYCTVEGRNTDREDGLFAAVREQGGKMQNAEYCSDWWRSLASVPADAMLALARQAIADWVRWDVEKYHVAFRPEQIELLAKELKIDLAKEWKLTRSFLELHTSAQLWELHDEWGVACLGSNMKRGEIVDTLERHGTKVPCPKELLELKPVRL